MAYGFKQSAAVRALLISATLFLSSTSLVSACGGVFDVKCNLENGGLSPDNIRRQAEKAAQDAANTGQKAVQDVANAINELQASVLTGPTLALAIQESRNSAIGTAQPIPPAMRQRLAGYASEDSLNRARYKIGDNGFANLARLIEQGGDTAAVTLIDVIVFRGPSEAEDPALWAHELTHVDQYSSWGVNSFAVQYTRQWQSVENPAYEKGNNYWNWANSAGQVRPYPSNGQGTVFNPPPVQIVYFCHTMIGRFGPFNPAQPGLPCFVNTLNGPVNGVTGP